MLFTTQFCFSIVKKIFPRYGMKYKFIFFLLDNLNQPKMSPPHHLPGKNLDQNYMIKKTSHKNQTFTSNDVSPSRGFIDAS